MSHSDSPRLTGPAPSAHGVPRKLRAPGYAPVSARVMGERSSRKPADARREGWNVPLLPVVTPRQLARHPRAAEYAKPHGHKGGARCCACPPAAPRVPPRAPHWTDAHKPREVTLRAREGTGEAPPETRDYAGRRTPQHQQYRQQRTAKTAWAPAKVEPDPVPPSAAFRLNFQVPPRLDPLVKVKPLVGRIIRPDDTPGPQRAITLPRDWAATADSGTFTFVPRTPPRGRPERYVPA